MSHRTARFATALVLLLTAAPSLVSAMWARMNTVVPSDRLIRNVERYVRLHPYDADGHYTLGRLHSLVYAGVNRPEVVPPGRRYDGTQHDLPDWAPLSDVEEATGPARRLTLDERSHLVASVREYRRAVQLAPREGLYLLGLGWMLEQGWHYADQLGDPPFPGNERVSAHGTSERWRILALAAYRRAYAATMPEELKKEDTFNAGDNVPVESGEGILRLQQGRRLSRSDTGEIDSVKQDLAAIRAKPHIVTPIIFPIDRPRSLPSLLAPGVHVKFDLAGDGGGELWPWVRPDTGILVWNPSHTGRVTSGIQLFGSASWWIFWKDGYRALAALDDDDDRWLRGHELDGIAVWIDRDQDGTCQPGEIVSLDSLGIDAIAVTAGSHSAAGSFNSSGLRKADGSFLPTYDWTPISQQSDLRTGTSP